VTRKNEVSIAIYQRHIQLYRFLNDAWIFTELMRPALDARARELIASASKQKRSYPVPKRDRSVTSKRFDRDVGAIFKAQHDRGVFETNVISIVSRAEAFVQECLFIAIDAQPRKLILIGERAGVPLDIFLQYGNHSDVLRAYIELRCQELMFGKPADYLAKVAKVLSIEIPEPIIQDYTEIKASRDIIVHSGGRINQLYLDKAGNGARGALGDELAIDADYFEHVVVCVKLLAGAIQRETEIKYG
jgi:hypothetical protein